MKCSSCEKVIPDGMAFCPYCGTKQADGKRLCPGCGAEVPEGMLYCGLCGTKYEPQPVAPAKAPDKPQEPQPVAPETVPSSQPAVKKPMVLLVLAVLFLAGALAMIVQRITLPYINGSEYISADLTMYSGAFQRIYGRRGLSLLFNAALYFFSAVILFWSARWVMRLPKGKQPRKGLNISAHLYGLMMAMHLIWTFANTVIDFRLF